MDVLIRKARSADTRSVTDTIIAAFGDTEGKVIAELVDNLLADPTAQPLLSLVAVVEDRVVGHVLFTNVRIEAAALDLPASILAPLAVRPDLQGRGIGGKLIAEGLQQLKDAGVALVFVLGYPDYYTRHGFSPAGGCGLDAPYPILPKNADAWMVQALEPGVLGEVTGVVTCAESLGDEKYWVE
jgi:predicted N-acetyltransferase YhbS